MKRKNIAFILILAFLCSSLNVFAFAFSDTYGHWAETSIKKWSKYEVVKGVGGNSFDPNGEMTRAEIATVISRLLSLTEKVDISSFSDVGKSAWYKEAFEKCVAAGIYKGDGNKLNPNSPVTREMFFTLLARTLEIPGEKKLNKTFSDTGSISSWAKEYTYAMINNGYVNGVSANKIAPKQSITRAAVISIIDRIIKNYVIDESTTVTVRKNEISVIKSDKCVISGDYFGTVFFSGSGITANFKNAKAQRVIITSSGVTLSNVPVGSTLIIKSGVKNTVVNGLKYNGDTSVTLKSADEGHKHISSDKVRENEVVGTCKKKSSYDEVVYCSLCNVEMSRKTVTGAYGDHDFVSGVCKLCGAKDTVTSPTVRVESISALPGDQIEIKIRIENNPGILGAIFSIKYDSDLTLTNAENGSAFYALAMTKPGKYVSGCNFVWDGLDEAAEGDGDILTLYFTVASNVSKGKELKLECSYVYGDVVDADFDPVKITTVNGVVKIK